MWWQKRDAAILAQIKLYLEERARQKQEKREQRRETRDYVAIAIALFAAAFTCWQAWEAHQTRKDTQVQFEQAQKRADRQAELARKDAGEAVDIQTKLADRSAEQAERSADAAKSAADTAHDTLFKGQRPWVGIDGYPIVLQPPQVTKETGVHADVVIGVKNFGISPALHVAINTGITIGPPTSDLTQFRRDADASCKMADMGSSPIVPGEERTGRYIFPGTTLTSRLNMTANSPYLDPNRGLDLVGCIAYTDQFKAKHHTRFCFMSQGRIDQIVANQPLVSCPMNEIAD
jgi:hypothetical protein